MALSPHDIPKIYGDVPPFMAVPYAPDLSKVKADAVIVGMPYDGIATYRGGATRRAPQEIRKYSLLFGDYNFDWDLDVFAHIKAVDVGDIDVAPGQTVESYARLERRIAEIHGTGAVPIMFGGDHGVTYPAVKAVAAHRGGPMGLIVFDTHMDLSESFREDRLTRASPIKRIVELPQIDLEPRLAEAAAALRESQSAAHAARFGAKLRAAAGETVDLVVEVRCQFGTFWQEAASLLETEARSPRPECSPEDATESASPEESK